MYVPPHIRTPVGPVNPVGATAYTGPAGTYIQQQQQQHYDPMQQQTTSYNGYTNNRGAAQTNSTAAFGASPHMGNNNNNNNGNQAQTGQRQYQYGVSQNQTTTTTTNGGYFANANGIQSQPQQQQALYAQPQQNNVTTFFDRVQQGGATSGNTYHAPQNRSNNFGGNASNNHYNTHNSGYNSSGPFRPRFNLQQDEAEVLDLFQTTGVSKGINFSNYENIPVTVHPVGRVEPIQSFRDANVPKELEENIQRCGYDQPTPVQKHCIPIALQNGDIMACAQTGSGKTAAFLLPVITKLLRNPPQGGTTYGTVFTQCVVMAPTRELAIQIHIEARKFCYKTRLRAAVLYGGADIRGQLHTLNAGGDVVIATPGRLWDVYQRGKVRFQKVQVLVLDEADRMLDMGFEPQIRQIVQSRDTDMPFRDARQTLMFSATFPKEIQNLAQEFLSRNYFHLTVGRIGSTTDSIVQTVGYVEDHEKFNALVDILSNQGEQDLTLVFAETKRGVEDVARRLARAGFPAVSIHGDKAQNEREAALSAFKNAVKPILVATDVASRGLDIPNVMTVVQYDLPHHIDEYVHRIGRTGRVGNEGEAIAFFAQKNLALAKDIIDILSEANQEVPDFLYEAVDAAAVHHQQKQWSRKSAGGGRGGRGGGYGGNRIGNVFQRQRGGSRGMGYNSQSNYHNTGNGNSGAYYYGNNSSSNSQSTALHAQQQTAGWNAYDAGSASNNNTTSAYGYQQSPAASYGYSAAANTNYYTGAVGYQ